MLDLEEAVLDGAQAGPPPPPAVGLAVGDAGEPGLNASELA
ncbi:MAG TPA: hypothetical protein VF880_19350 [Actinomycetes bacterium]